MGNENERERALLDSLGVEVIGNARCIQLPAYQKHVYILKEHLDDLLLYFENYIKFNYDNIRYQKKEILKICDEEGEENRDVRIMIAYDDKYLISKVISGLDTHSETVVDGVNLLFDVNSMKLLSILPTDTLTYMRTSIMNGLGLKYLAPSTVSKIAILGAGKLCFYCLPLIPTILGEAEIWIYDVVPSKAEALKDKMEGIIDTIEVANSIRQAVVGAEVIIALTPSRKPIVFYDQIKKGVHINTLGADTEGKQQIDPWIVRESKIVVDDVEQSLKYGELNVMHASNQISERDIYGTIFEIVRGEKRGRESDKENTLFDSSGIPAEDFIASLWYMEKGLKKF